MARRKTARQTRRRLHKASVTGADGVNTASLKQAWKARWTENWAAELRLAASTASPPRVCDLPDNGILSDDGATHDLHTSLANAVAGSRVEPEIRALQLGKKEMTVHVEGVYTFVVTYRGACGGILTVARPGMHCPEGAGRIFAEITHVKQFGGALAWSSGENRVLGFGHGVAIECFEAPSGMCYLEEIETEIATARQAYRLARASPRGMGATNSDSKANGGLAASPVGIVPPEGAQGNGAASNGGKAAGKRGAQTSPDRAAAPAAKRTRSARS